MTEQALTQRDKRKLGPKPYPNLGFEQSLELARAIDNQGVRRIRRLTLFMQIGRSPGSSASRTLIAASAKYGLTNGNFNSDYLEITEDGSTVSLGSIKSDPSVLITSFDMAIAKNAAFSALYEQQKNKRIPPTRVLCDIIAQEGIDETDLESAVGIFLDNVRYLGLMQTQFGGEYLIALEQLLENMPQIVSVDNGRATDVEEPPHRRVSAEEPSTPATTILPRVPQSDGPSVHIDIQIHIDSTASSEQIEQVFASMARHLYLREG